jgi:hypothetical protein
MDNSVNGYFRQLPTTQILSATTAAEDKFAFPKYHIKNPAGATGYTTNILFS